MASVRIETQKAYTGGLFILDLQRAPWGCGASYADPLVDHLGTDGFGVGQLSGLPFGPLPRMRFGLGWAQYLFLPNVLGLTGWFRMAK
jgi:hypothetical protein